MLYIWVSVLGAPITRARPLFGSMSSKNANSKFTPSKRKSKAPHPYHNRTDFPFEWFILVHGRDSVHDYGGYHVCLQLTYPSNTGEIGDLNDSFYVIHTMRRKIPIDDEQVKIA